MIVVFDIDGVLADSSHRVKKYLLDPPVKDWDGLFANNAIKADKPVVAGLTLLKMFFEDGDDLYLWTGRPEKTRIATEAWLYANTRFYGYPIRLWMRPNGDHRDDDVLKADFIKRLGRNPDLVFEDRDRIVAMYRARGITCYQTQAGAF